MFRWPTFLPMTTTSWRSTTKTFLALALAASLALSGCSTDAEAENNASDGSYTVEHAMGSTTIDGPVDRVVVIDSPHLDSLVALDVIPVGATESGAAAGFPDYLPDQLEETESVGETMDPNIEKIASPEPDLIIGAKVRHEEIYEQLSAIAPTVYSEGSGTNWQEQATITAAAVNKSDEMEEQIAALDERAAALGESIPEGATASMVRFRPENFRLYGPETFSGSILSQVGFDLGERDWNEYSMMELSPENFAQIDGDYIFYTVPGGDETLTTKPTVEGLWGNQPGVENGQVYEFEDETWMVGIGVLGGNAILDDLEPALST